MGGSSPGVYPPGLRGSRRPLPSAAPEVHRPPLHCLTMGGGSGTARRGRSVCRPKMPGEYFRVGVAPPDCRLITVHPGSGSSLGTLGSDRPTARGCLSPYRQLALSERPTAIAVQLPV